MSGSLCCYNTCYIHKLGAQVSDHRDGSFGFSGHSHLTTDCAKQYRFCEIECDDVLLIPSYKVTAPKCNS